jgi:hypothetical protein
MLFAVLSARRRHFFVQQRQIEICDIYQLELSAAVRLSLVKNPFGNGTAVSVWARATDDYANSKHPNFSCLGM